jgi:hypothetical protein
MSLSSASALTDVEAAYDDNASYRELNNPAAAATFITACRMLLRRYAAEIQLGNRHKLRFDGNLVQLRQEMLSAQQWLATSNAAGNNQPVFPDFGNFRG